MGFINRIANEHQLPLKICRDGSLHNRKPFVSGSLFGLPILLSLLVNPLNTISDSTFYQVSVAVVWQKRRV